ncbi:uncharacterized protein LOC134825333 isoform X1 [Bolinopsis microptera]|uniref:uncharacterized protein LOC134825333 isoform X1 n=1 Tax=Bolinopsis microptera TaxID=2820187 RepID=UPI003079F558
MLSVLILWLYISSVLSDPGPGTVLVLGGQELAGSATLTALLDAEFQVNTLNEDNPHYDYHELFENKVERIVCSRSSGLDGCVELQNLINSNSKVKAIVDFTSDNKELMEEAVRVLAPLSPDVYIFVSTAAVYDVSDNPQDPLKESDAVRPEDLQLQDTYNEKNVFGHDMLGSEEALIASGLPYVILRCGDLIGPRDTTLRWWQYQVWSEHFVLLDEAFPVHEDKQHLKFSMTYGDDLAKAVVSVINKGVMNEVYNIAMEKTFTLPHVLLELCIYFGNGDKCWADYHSAVDSYSLYPNNHMGMLDIEHAKTDLDFEASSWEDVLKDTITFYERARHNHTKERDMVLSRLNENVLSYLQSEQLIAAVMRQEGVEMENEPNIPSIEL